MFALQPCNGRDGDTGLVAHVAVTAPPGGRRVQSPGQSTESTFRTPTETREAVLMLCENSKIKIPYFATANSSPADHVCAFTHGYTLSMVITMVISYITTVMIVLTVGGF